MTRRAERWIWAFSVFLLAGLPLGCGGVRLHPVSGSVTYQGQPATGAAVHFHREGATPEEAAAFPIGIVDGEGKFQLETPGLGRGALPGQYKVLVRWAPPPDESPASATAASPVSSSIRKKDPKADTDRLQFRYFRIQQPLLTAEVKPEANQLPPFELKD